MGFTIAYRVLEDIRPDNQDTVLIKKGTIGEYQGRTLEIPYVDEKEYKRLEALYPPFEAVPLVDGVPTSITSLATKTYILELDDPRIYYRPVHVPYTDEDIQKAVEVK